jgi:hypothetical protein
MPCWSATAPGGRLRRPCLRRIASQRHQKGKKLRVPDNITLLSLPPYAPELNPTETVWEYLRANKLCRLVWNSYEEIVQACKEAWDFLINDPDRIASIGIREWAYVNV